MFSIQTKLPFTSAQTRPLLKVLTLRSILIGMGVMVLCATISLLFFFPANEPTKLTNPAVKVEESVWSHLTTSTKPTTLFASIKHFVVSKPYISGVVLFATFFLLVGVIVVCVMSTQTSDSTLDLLPNTNIDSSKDVRINSSDADIDGPADTDEKQGTLEVGATIGIVFGVVAFLLLLGGGIYLFKRYKVPRNDSKLTKDDEPLSMPKDESAVKHKIDINLRQQEPLDDHDADSNAPVQGPQTLESVISQIRSEDFEFFKRGNDVVFRFPHMEKLTFFSIGSTTHEYFTDCFANTYGRPETIGKQMYFVLKNAVTKELHGHANALLYVNDYVKCLNGIEMDLGKFKELPPPDQQMPHSDPPSSEKKVSNH